MVEEYLKKVVFLKQFNLEAITPVKDSLMILRNHVVDEPCHNADLANKNNSIITGYENFCVKKGTLKLLPNKDFHFIGKHVVCQKCCQKFASIHSYQIHAGTDMCVRTYNGPNLIYLKYKNRNYRQTRKKKKRKSKKVIDRPKIKQNVLNPEILNTLQTRNKVYSDNMIEKQNKVKEKAMNYSYEYNDEPSVKRPRGRPKKNIISNNVEVNLKKRGRPKKLNAVTFNGSNQNDNSSSSNVEIFDSFKMKCLLAKFWKLFTKEFKQKFVDIHKYQYPTKHQSQYNEGKKGDLSAEENEIFLKIEELEYDFKFLFKQFKGKKECPFNDELQLILTKISETRDGIKQSLLKKTDMKGSIPDEGKENIKHTLKKNKNETEIEMNNKDFDKNEKCIGILINNRNTVSPTITMKINDGCKSINYVNEDNFKKEPTSQDSFEDNLKTLTVDKTPNITNSVKNNLNDHGLNNILNSTLNCMKCRKKFTSIAEQKLHCSEHLDKISDSFLCSVCGHRFRMYKNYKEHVKIHKKTEKKKLNYNNKRFKNFICKICNKQYDYLVSYYSHIKTHINK